MLRKEKCTILSISWLLPPYRQISLLACVSQLPPLMACRKPEAISVTANHSLTLITIRFNASLHLIFSAWDSAAPKLWTFKGFPPANVLWNTQATDWELNQGLCSISHSKVYLRSCWGLDEKINTHLISYHLIWGCNQETIPELNKGASVVVAAPH